MSIGYFSDGDGYFPLACPANYMSSGFLKISIRWIVAMVEPDGLKSSSHKPRGIGLTDELSHVADLTIRYMVVHGVSGDSAHSIQDLYQRL